MVCATTRDTITEAGGVELGVAAIVDGEALRRSGASVVGVPPLAKPVRACFVAALPANNRTGDVLEATANGVIANADGVVLVNGDEVLVTFEVTAANHGVYVVTDIGSGGSHWKLTRRSDYPGGSAVASGTVFRPLLGDTVRGVSVYVDGAVAAVNTNGWTFGVPAGTRLRLTRYVSSAGNPITHNYHPFARWVEPDMDGGGAGGHYAIGAGAQSALGAGGASGQRWRGRIAITGASTIFVGAGGVGGVGGGGGTVPTAGGDTTLLMGATTYRAKGGGIGSTVPAGTTITRGLGGAAPGGGTGEGTNPWVTEAGRNGEEGQRFSGALAYGGRGGDGPDGGGGLGGVITGGAGGNANGHGAGGGGASAVGATNNNGGAGADGSAELVELG